MAVRIKYKPKFVTEIEKNEHKEIVDLLKYTLVYVAWQILLEKQRANKPHFYCENSKTQFNSASTLLLY